VSFSSVKRSLSKINTRKAAGPDSITGNVLKNCADELKDVLRDIFNISLSQAVFPTFKATTMSPRHHPYPALMAIALLH